LLLEPGGQQFVIRRSQSNIFIVHGGAGQFFLQFGYLLFVFRIEPGEISRPLFTRFDFRMTA